MVRVLRPGGILLCVEPNNIATNVARLVTDPELDPDEVSAFVKFQTTCERGKHRLGRGFNSLGEYLTEHMFGLELEAISSSVCDRCSLVVPPSNSPSSLELIAELERMREQNALIWPRSETHEYFLAGGGEPHQFEELWRVSNDVWYRRLQRTSQGRLFANAGALLYLVSARKRSAGSESVD